MVFHLLCAIPFVFQIAYAAVDCAKEQNHDLCKQEGVDGYPTFNYYNYGKFVEKYNGERGVSIRTGCNFKKITAMGRGMTCLSIFVVNEQDRVNFQCIAKGFNFSALISNSLG